MRPTTDMHPASRGMRPISGYIFEPPPTPQSPLRGICDTNGAVQTFFTSLDDVNESSNESSTPRDSENSAARWRVPRKTWALVLASLAMFLTSFGIAVYPPFFPKLASSKNATTSVYGFLLGLDSLVTFIVTPPIANNIGHFGANLSFASGILTSGISCILTGALVFLPSGAVFFVMAALARAINAVGCSACLSAFFVILNMDYPNKSAKIFAYTRTLMNAASLLAPMIGGALVQAGGFETPFFVIGSLQIVVAIATCPLLIRHSRKRAMLCPNVPDTGRAKRSSWSLLAITPLWIPLMTFLLSSSLNGFLSVSLEQYILSPFQLSPFVIGLFFSLRDLVNFLGTPAWAIICDHTVADPKFWIIVATVAASFSIFIMGVLPLINFNASLFAIGIALCLNGLGFAGQQVAGVEDATQVLLERGLGEDPAIHGLVAGLWSALSGAGRFISRTATGVLIDQIGFEHTSLVILGTQFAVIILALLAVLLRSTKCCRKEETETLSKDSESSNLRAS